MENSNCQNILLQIKAHTRYRRQCLNLIASENVMSPMTASLLSSDLANRYSVGRPYARWFPGLNYYDKIENLAEDLSKKLFRANYANVQAPTGMAANMVAYLALLSPGDLVMSLNVKNSGHYSHAAENIFSRFQIRVEPLPFDIKEYSIDIAKAIRLIRRKRPQMIILGTSEFLFPAPIGKLRAICDETNTKILYDASHVSGLIAGQTFQDPLTEGADILTMSTNKTLAAPSHGIVACRDRKKYQTKIEQAIIPVLTSNHHAHHVAALAMTLSEFEVYGHDYAVQIIKNARTLAQDLYGKGVAVLCPHKNFTRSHTVLFDAGKNGNEVMHLLEKVNIIVNPFQLPGNKVTDPTGIRIGTNEMTRLGMKEKEMETIAEFISDTLMDRKPINKIRYEVIEFRKSYRKIRYCFPD